MKLDLALIDLITGASLIVQFVMLTLLAASMITWTIIFMEKNRIKKSFEGFIVFEKKFWSGVELSKLYNNLTTQDENTNHSEQVFLAGFKEFLRLRKQHISAPHVLLGGVERAMRIQTTKVIHNLEEKLPILATIQSVSPFIGLFGTVWGVMHAFRGLGSVQQVSLAMVAPGIAEALIATAMGLLAAIPASIAYNRFISQVEGLSTRLGVFSEEFLNILYRETHSKVARPLDAATKDN